MWVVLYNGTIISLLITFNVASKSDELKEWQEKWKHCLEEKIKHNYKTTCPILLFKVSIYLRMEKRQNDIQQNVNSGLYSVWFFFFFILPAFLYFLKFYNEHALLLQKRKNRSFQVDQF